jgi:hypothetical protein
VNWVYADRKFTLRFKFLMGFSCDRRSIIGSIGKCARYEELQFEMKRSPMEKEKFDAQLTKAATFYAGNMFQDSLRASMEALDMAESSPNDRLAALALIIQIGGHSGFTGLLDLHGALFVKLASRHQLEKVREKNKSLGSDIRVIRSADVPLEKSLLLALGCLPSNTYTNSDIDKFNASVDNEYFSECDHLTESKIKDVASLELAEKDQHEPAALSK